jgi:hypothetical protein
MTDVGQIGTALRALAADLVTERERVRSLSRENRALLRENRELLERLEAIQPEATVCPHCGLPMFGAEVAQLERHRRPLSATRAASRPA